MADSCVWPVDTGCLPEVSTDHERAVLAEAVDTAVYVLWAMTARQFGCQRVTVRPCPQSCGCTAVRGFMPVLLDGRWLNVTCGGECRADGPGVVRLPGPVHHVESVAVDGTEVASASYVLEGDRLYRAAGESWPGQNLRAPLGEPGTWGVTYLRGTPPPAGAGQAVGVLAREFWNVCQGGRCRLPARWQSVQRQGVTVARADPTDLLNANQTGLPQVDLWIHAANPHGADRPPRVVTPESRVLSG